MKLSKEKVSQMLHDIIENSQNESIFCRLRDVPPSVTYVEIGHAIWSDRQNNIETRTPIIKINDVVYKFQETRTKRWYGWEYCVSPTFVEVKQIEVRKIITENVWVDIDGTDSHDVIVAVAISSEKEDTISNVRRAIDSSVYGLTKFV